MLQDVRLAFRTLGDQKAFAAAALITLAVGIGATTAIFSVAYGVLVRPLPFPEPDGIVQLSEHVPGGQPAVPGALWISNLTLDAWEPGRTTIGPIGTFSMGTATVGFDVPQRLPRGDVNPAFFDVLGVAPALGRFFREADAIEGAAPVAVIGDEIWRERFGADAGIIGRTLLVDDRPHQIVGIAPRGLGLPQRNTRIWTPSIVSRPISPNSRDVRVGGTGAIARLIAGRTASDAAAEGTAAARTTTRPIAAEMLFGKGGAVEIHARPLAVQMTANVRVAVVVVLVGVLLLLIIACVNVANLFLSRGVARERDLAVRVALGAGRRRLARQLITENLVVSLLGGALGFALAWSLLRLLPAIAPESFPRIDAVSIDWRTPVSALALSVVAGLLSGLVPAIRGARPDLLASLREGTGASSSRRVTWLRRAFLVAEAALAVLLLVGATLLGRSFVRLMQTEGGYDAEGVLTADVYLPGASRGQADTAAFVTDLVARVRSRPGVIAAGASNMSPFNNSTYIAGFTVPLPGREPVTARALAYVVTPGYAEALNLRLRAGRLLDERDVASGLQAVVVNDAFVKTFLAGLEPIGVRFPSFLYRDGRGPSTAEIVGVVGDVLKNSLEDPSQPAFYVVARDSATIRREINLVLRTTTGPSVSADEIRRLVRDIRPDAALDRVAPLTAQLADSVANRRFSMGVLLMLAGVALLLAAVGLYGVLSYNVARRRREIGVRAALGATRGAMMRMVIGEGLAVVAGGLVFGLAAAAALTRLMQTLLVGIQPLDAVSFAAAPAVLLLVAFVACLLPARRAATIDPARALRLE